MHKETPLIVENLATPQAVHKAEPNCNCRFDLQVRIDPKCFGVELMLLQSQQREICTFGSDSPDLKQISALGGGDLPPTPPEALGTLLAGSSLAAKAEQGDLMEIFPFRGI